MNITMMMVMYSNFSLLYFHLVSLTMGFNNMKRDEMAWN